MHELILAAADVTGVLVDTARTVGGGVVEGVVQAVGAGAAAYVVGEGTRRVYRAVKGSGGGGSGSGGTWTCQHSDCGHVNVASALPMQDQVCDACWRTRGTSDAEPF